jgi:hypothetical protein
VDYLEWLNPGLSRALLSFLMELLRVVAWGSVERAKQQANPKWCQFGTDSKVMMHIKMMYVCMSS